MTVIEDHRQPDITLKSGAHKPGSEDMCLVEYVAWLAGEGWSDHPECVCPVLAAFGRAWNDGLPDDETRTRLLLPFAERLVGTRSTAEVQDRRAFMAADWAVRTYTPIWLRAAGLVDEAVSLEQLPVLLSVESCRSAQPTIDAARAAAWDAAWVAARDAARVAAGDAAWVAARDAAWVAAWDAARVTAWAAARDAAGATAGATAWVAAGDAAWVAAMEAARDAAWDAAWDAAMEAAWEAAGDAARAALAPHVTTLQASAVDLFDRMINTTERNL